MINIKLLPKKEDSIYIDNFNWLKITQEYENIIYKTIEDHKNADL
jgi:hypothetical protein